MIRTLFPLDQKSSTLARAARRQSGFTLIEIMIVVAIVAILAAIALPGYQDSVRKTWRNKATSCLTEMAQSMERRFTANMSYVGAALPGNACVVEDGMAARYALDFVAAPAANAFQLRATPQGAQVADTVCAILTINQVGVRTVSGTGGVDDCWQ